MDIMAIQQRLDALARDQREDLTQLGMLAYEAAQQADRLGTAQASLCARLRIRESEMQMLTVQRGELVNRAQASALADAIKAAPVAEKGGNDGEGV